MWTRMKIRKCWGPHNLRRVPELSWVSCRNHTIFTQWRVENDTITLALEDGRKSNHSEICTDDSKQSTPTPQGIRLYQNFTQPRERKLSPTSAPSLPASIKIERKQLTLVKVTAQVHMTTKRLRLNYRIADWFLFFTSHTYTTSTPVNKSQLQPR